MATSWKSSAATGLVLLFGSLQATSASHLAIRNGTCSQLSQRKAWHTLTDAEKAEYIRAEKCLMNSPAKGDVVDGAVTRFDELQWAHIAQSNVIHGVGAFLPWHRYYIKTHEYLLQTECNYTGGQPYWDEQLDADASTSLADGSVWGSDDLSFGTNGREADGCVIDGPFANTTLRLNQQWGVNNFTEYCLARAFTDTDWAWSNTSYTDACFAKENYTVAWSCWSKYPHSSVHLSTGGTLLDQSASPGDPVFFLHHTNLDRLWWQWQQMDWPARLTQMDGKSIPSDTALATGKWLSPTAAEMDYDGDAYNTTTLAHVLSMVGILPNITIADMMDIGNDLNCAEYI